MATTTNFGWTTPDDTDLVKDGAAAIRTLGSAIDTSLVDLKGGTTGQILAKASNTDLDFTWSNDAGISPTILDAKGDLISATAADTPARLGVGANGTVLTADSAESTGLKWATPAAGGMTLINTGGTTLSGASVTISSIPATYNNLELYILNARPASDAGVRIQLNGDTGATSYVYVQSFEANSQSFSYDYLLAADTTDNGVSNGLVKVELPLYANTSTYKYYISLGYSPDATTPANADLAGWQGAWKSTAAIDSIKVYPSTGNWTSGTLYLYGVK